MKPNSKRRFIVLNLLMIVFTMNAVLAHSACFMGVAPAEQSPSAEIALQQGDMPCHQQNNPDSDNQEAPTPNQCCSACSIMHITVDTLNQVTEKHSQKVNIALISLITHTPEIPFRPPINSLS
jgi:hypothetical protein